LPGRIPLPPRLGALLAGRIEGTLGSVETVTGGIERAFGLLHRSQGLGDRILGCSQPAPQLGQLPDCLAAFPRPVCHPTIVAGNRGPATARQPCGPAGELQPPASAASRQYRELDPQGCGTGLQLDRARQAAAVG
jgi:hypothetical protein